jgi:hypothetical protein
MAAVDAVLIEKKLCRTAAMSARRRENPQLFEQFQEV